MRTFKTKPLLISLLTTIALAGCNTTIKDLDQWRQLPIEKKQRLVDADKDGVIVAREKCEETGTDLLVDNYGCTVEHLNETDLDHDVEFDQGSLELGPSQQLELTEYLNGLAINKQWEFTVQGYTTSAGDLLLNEYLAKQRISAVADYLRSQTGVPLTNIRSQLLDGDKVAEYDNAQNFSTENPDDKDQDGVLDEFDQCGNSGFTVEVDENGCPVMEIQQITKNVTVRFEVDSSDIQSIYLPNVREVAQFINTYNAKQVKVVGHASLTGDANYNLGLSARRAEAVAELLVNAYGINPDYIEAYGRGETQPVMDEISDQANELNRRVEIVLSESLEVEKQKDINLLDANALNRRVTVIAQTKEMANKLKWNIFLMEQLQQTKDKEQNSQDAIEEAKDAGW